MQNSNLKKEILGQPKEATAAELNAYLNGELSPSEAWSVEDKMHSSDFTSEAVEGIKTYGDTALITELKQKYSAQNSWWNLNSLLLLSSAIIGVCAFVYFYSGTPESENSAEKQVALPVSQQEETFQTELHNGESKITQNTEAITGNKIELNEVPEASQVNSDKDLEDMPILFSSELQKEISNVNVLSPKSGNVRKVEEKIALKTKAARLRHYRNFKLVDQGIDQSLLEPLIQGTPAFSEKRIINPKHPDWVPADSVYRASMNEAIDWLIDEKYTLASQRLKRLFENNSEDLTATFYLGYSYYLDAEFEKAISMFKKTQMHELQTFDHDSRYLQLLSHLELGQTNEAEAVAEYLNQAGSVYAERAVELVE